MGREVTGQPFVTESRGLAGASASAGGRGRAGLIWALPCALLACHWRLVPPKASALRWSFCLQQRGWQVVTRVGALGFGVVPFRIPPRGGGGKYLLGPTKPRVFFQDEAPKTDLFRACILKLGIYMYCCVPFLGHIKDTSNRLPKP